MTFRPFLAALTVALPLAALPLTASPAQAREMEDMGVSVLRTIDKLSARTHTFEIPVGKTVKFGKSLFIKVRACRKASPLDEPDNAAFLQVWERLSEDAESQWIFSGWMFSSNPSLSAMDHGVYDVWVIDCKNNATAAKSEEYSSEKAPVAAPEEAAAKPVTAGDALEVAPVKEPIPADAPKPEEMSPVAPVSGGDSKAAPTLQELPGSFEDGAAAGGEDAAAPEDEGAPLNTGD